MEHPLTCRQDGDHHHPCEHRTVHLLQHVSCKVKLVLDESLGGGRTAATLWL